MHIYIYVHTLQYIHMYIYIYVNMYSVEVCSSEKIEYVNGAWGRVWVEPREVDTAQPFTHIHLHVDTYIYIYEYVVETRCRWRLG